MTPARARLRCPVAALLVLGALLGFGCGGASKPPALRVSTQSPADGQRVTGNITWQVSVSGATPTRIDFAIDGTVRWTQRSAPYLYGGAADGLDTTKLADGSHVLSATAYGAEGSGPATSQVSVTVGNNQANAQGVYWGAWIGPQLTGTEAPWDMSAVTKFEQMTGKPLSILHFSSPFADCSSSPCSYFAFPSKAFDDIRAHGAIPFLSWSSMSIPWGDDEPHFQLADLIGGTYDSYIRAFATRAREWGRPFFLRFDWEMNGRWFPWGEGANGNARGEYVRAWRHVHGIFDSVGAANVSWVWCPYIDQTAPVQSLTPLYPGDAYVDWTCLDGYNWGANPTSPKVWRSFDQLFGPSYRALTQAIAPGKPLIVGETASGEHGGSKAGWIHNMFGWLPTEYPRIRGLLWFEKVEHGVDWPLESSKSSLNSFAAGIRDPRYAANDFGGISASPIPPP